jgi:hypothetical protein
MVKCPNCGSFTKITKLGDSEYPTSQHVIETWRCLCGCVVRRTMKTVTETIHFPDGKEIKQTI